MPTITNYDLGQQIRKIANQSQSSRIRSTGTSSTDTTTDTTTIQDTKITLESKPFKKLGNYNTELICNDGTRAVIIQPMPCMKWSSRKAIDNNGDVELDVELSAAILTVGDTSIALGYYATDCGLSKDLEILIDLGDTELLMNNEFYSVKAKHHARDGVEI